MLTRIYVGLWFAVILTAGVIFLAGNFTMLTAVVFGFIAFGLVFMGMMCVLPSSVAHPRPIQPEVGATDSRAANPRIGVADRLHAFVNGLGSGHIVEVHKPKYR